ncbi:MAG TPA: TonB family protein [Rhizomicrobium sp.]|jgi:TonB family protein|nr:TonB family protein [Rhizomicrobium sp.]
MRSKSGTFAVAAVCVLLLGAAAPADTSPVPLNSHDISAFYPELSRRLSEEGEVYVRFTVGEDGTVSNATVVKSSGAERLDAAALAAVTTWRYKPAVHDGKPVAAVKTVALEFSLTDPDSIYAGSDAQAMACKGKPPATVAQQIAACTAILATAGLGDDDRMATLSHRNAAYRRLAKFPEALADADTAVAAHPEDVRPLLMRGETRFDAGQYDGTIADMTAVLRLSPDMIDALKYRGRALSTTARCADAVHDFDEAIRIAPDVAALHFHRATAYACNNQVDLAIADIAVTIRLDPKMPDGYNSRSAFYNSLHQFDSAAADAETAIKLEPSWPPPYVNLGTAQFGQGHCDLAIATLGEALSRDPANASALLARSQCYEELGKYELALTDSDAVIAAAPQAYEGYAQRAFVRVNLKQYAPAVADADKGLGLNPNSALSLAARGLARHGLGQNTDALADFDKAIALLPNYAPLYLYRAYSRDAVGRYADSVADTTQAIALKLETFAVYNTRCWARAAWGQQLPDALADCNTSLQMEPGRAAVLNSRAFVYFRLGNYAAVLADDTAAIAGNAKEPSSFYIRGLAKLKLGDAAGGNADIAAAQAIDPGIAKEYAGYSVTP